MSDYTECGSCGAMFEPVSVCDECLQVEVDGMISALTAALDTLRARYDKLEADALSRAMQREAIDDTWRRDEADWFAREDALRARVTELEGENERLVQGGGAWGHPSDRERMLSRVAELEAASREVLSAHSALTKNQSSLIRGMT